MKGERTMKGAVASSTWLGLSAFVRRRRYLFGASTTEEGALFLVGLVFVLG